MHLADPVPALLSVGSCRIAAREASETSCCSGVGLGVCCCSTVVGVARLLVADFVRVLVLGVRRLEECAMRHTADCAQRDFPASTHAAVLC